MAGRRELWGDRAPDTEPEAAPPQLAAESARARVAALRARVGGDDARAMDAANAAATAAFAALARPTAAEAALARRLSDLQARFGDGFVVIVRRADELLAAPELSPGRGAWAAPGSIVAEVLRLEQRAAEHEARYGRFVGALTDACAAVTAGDAGAVEAAAEDVAREAPADVRAGLRAAAGLGDQYKPAIESLQNLERSSAAAKKESVALFGASEAAATAYYSKLDALVADLAQAVTLQEAGRLIKVSGIGKKTAERIVLELKDRLPRAVASFTSSRSSGSGSSGHGPQPLRSHAQNATF